MALGIRALSQSTTLAKPHQMVTAEVDPRHSCRDCYSRRSSSVRTDAYQQA